MKYLAFAFALYAAILTSTHAHGSHNGGPDTCKPYFSAVEQLANDYQEKPTKGYITDKGTMIVIFENPETETWTIVLVSPNAIACGKASGTGITDHFPEIETPGDPS